ncbi:7113_t:CDS:2 [Cetraspora pellucida]|uniref:7113_t:CDS:1 n=1 Tax=Cetraspora pellucida TaxID=1433469 RepID=A0A9N9N4Q5_9GLOM|nr:7113_t:CDS:2 [Cetraspora pellucida]
MASDVKAKDFTLQENQETKVDPSLTEEPKMTQEVQIMPMSDDNVNDIDKEKAPTSPTEKRKSEQPQPTKVKESPDVDGDNDENKSDESVEPPPAKRTRTSTRKMNSPISKRRKSSSNSSNQSSPKRGRGRKPSIKSENEVESDEFRQDQDDDDDDYKTGDSDYEEVEKKPSIKKKGKSGQHAKKKTAWKVDEDNYMIDFILGEMPSPAWNRIAKGLEGRTPNSCLVRWKTLQKRLYQTTL